MNHDAVDANSDALRLCDGRQLWRVDRRRQRHRRPSSAPAPAHVRCSARASRADAVVLARRRLNDHLTRSVRVDRRCPHHAPDSFGQIDEQPDPRASQDISSTPIAWISRRARIRRSARGRRAPDHRRRFGFEEGLRGGVDQAGVALGPYAFENRSIVACVSASSATMSSASTPSAPSRQRRQRAGAGPCPPRSRTRLERASVSASTENSGEPLRPSASIDVYAAVEEFRGRRFSMRASFRSQRARRSRTGRERRPGRPRTGSDPLVDLACRSAGQRPSARDRPQRLEVVLGRGARAHRL